MLILGLDPSLTSTGWGLVRLDGVRLVHVANGEVRTQADDPMAQRLYCLHQSILAVIADHRPDRAAIEEVFANRNAQSTLKLAQARGAVLSACGARGLEVREYSTRLVKKSVVGTGGADKKQVQAMLAVLLPGVRLAGSDAADALAVAIADAHLGSRPAEMVAATRRATSR